MRFRDLVRVYASRLGGGDSHPAEAQPLEAPDERRVEPRVERFGWARYAAGELEGEGLVVDLSITGARMRNCSLPLEPGAKLALRLKPSGGFPTLPIAAEVARTTRDGFAVHFVDLDRRVRERLVDVVEGALRGI